MAIEKLATEAFKRAVQLDTEHASGHTERRKLRRHP
jgi:hypothetical protein